MNGYGNLKFMNNNNNNFLKFDHLKHPNKSKI